MPCAWLLGGIALLLGIWFLVWLLVPLDGGVGEP